MVPVVQEQNVGDPLYKPMAGQDDTSVAFQAASDLVFNGSRSPAAIPSRCCMRGG
jgi:malate synthase